MSCKMHEHDGRRLLAANSSMDNGRVQGLCWKGFALHYWNTGSEKNGFATARSTTCPVRQHKPQSIPYLLGD